MKIGILQTGHAPAETVETLGDYPDMFARLLAGHGFDFDAWPVVDGVFPPGPEAADGWLVTGSKYSSYEDHPWIRPLEDLLRAIAASNRPMIGICRYAGLAYGDTILTVQPHPEFGADMIAALIRHRGPGVIDAAQLAQAEARLDTALDAPDFANRMADFFKRTAS